MSQSTSLPPAGWYPDPAGSGGERYWDGGNWSKVTRPAGGLQTPQQSPVPQRTQGPDPYQAYQGAAHPQKVAVRLAGFWWRVLASILDSLILMVPLSLLQGSIMGGAIVLYEGWLQDMLKNMSPDQTMPPLPDGIIGPYLTYLLVSAVIWAIYRIVMVARLGATFGQLATGLRVVREGDDSLGLIGWGKATLREGLAVVFGQLPLIGVINVLAMLFNAKKQTIHDMIARTLVVKKS